MNYKVRKVFIALALVFTLFLSNQKALIEADTVVDIKNYFDADPTSGSFVTGVNLSFGDDYQTVPPLIEVTSDTDVHFKISFKIPTSISTQIKTGDYYDIKISDEIKFDHNLDGVLVFEEKEFASYTVSTSGMIRIIFNDVVNEFMEIEGNIEISGNFNLDFINDDGDIIISVPTEEDIPGVGVIVKPPKNAAIEKSGHTDRNPNPNSITWNIVINKSLETLNNVSVKEVYPSQVTFDSLKVYKIFINLDGTINDQKTPVLLQEGSSDGEYSYINDEVIFHGTIQDAYRIDITTTINENEKLSEGASFKAINEAILKTDELDDISAESSVSVIYNKMIEKKNVSYNPDTQISNWEVKYNYQEKSIDLDKAYFIDSFDITDFKSAFIKDSLKVMKVTFNETGSSTSSEAIEGVDYEVIKFEDNSLRINFLSLDSDNLVKNAYNITYSIHHDDVVTSGWKFTNKIQMDDESLNTEGSFTPPQTALVKTHFDVDYNGRRITWSIDINKPMHQMQSMKITDTIEKGLEFIDDSFTLTDVTSDTILRRGIDYDLEYDNAQSILARSILITMNGDYADTNHQFNLTYKTKFIPNDIVGDSFTNNVFVEWHDVETGKDYELEDSDDFKPDRNNMSNGAKWGMYNANDKLITWSIAYDYNNYGIASSGTIVDEIQGNQVYVPNSLRAFEYLISPENGNVIKGDPVDLNTVLSDYTEPSKDNNQTLSINLKRLIPSENLFYMFEFDTSLEGQVIMEESSYYNTAYYDAREGYIHELNGKVSIAHANERIVKSGVQNEDGFVEWTLKVNQSQSEMSNVKVLDTFSSDQVVVTESIKVYGTHVDAKGNVTKDELNLLEENKDYKLTIKQVTKIDDVSLEESKHWQLELEFLISPIITAYQIEYMTQVMIEDNSSQQEVYNDAKIIGFNEELIEQESTSKVPVINTHGTGVIIGKRGSLEIKKVNDDGIALADAVFEIYKKDDENLTQIGGSLTTDENGLISIANLGPAAYVLKEVSAPDGHTLSNELREGIEVIVEYPEHSELMNIEIVNERFKVILNKKNSTGDSLSKAEFELSKKIGSEYIVIHEDEKLITDASGTLEIIGLLEGEYKLKEVKAPKGYVLNTEEVEFTVTKNMSNNIILNDYVNYKGGFELKKTDEQGNVLQGVMYQLTSNDGQTLNLVSDENGIVSNFDLGPGTYILKETKSLDGYILNDEEIEFAIDDSHFQNLVALQFEQINYKGSLSLKKTDEQGNILPGVKYSLLDDNNILISEHETDEQGMIVIKELAPGTYYLQESEALESFILNTEKLEVIIPKHYNGEFKTIELEQINYQGSVEITKVGSDGKYLDSVQFELLMEDGTLVHEILETDTKGKILIDKLAPGNYILKEVKTKDGYLLDDKDITFTIVEEFEGEVALVKLNIVNDLIPIIPDKPNSDTGIENNTMIYLLILIMGSGILLRMRRIR